MFCRWRESNQQHKQSQWFVFSPKPKIYKININLWAEKTQASAFWEILVGSTLMDKHAHPQSLSRSYSQKATSPLEKYNTTARICTALPPQKKTKILFVALLKLFSDIHLCVSNTWRQTSAEKRELERLQEDIYHDIRLAAEVHRQASARCS